MSFLRDYLEVATGNECPHMFHVWCGYSALAAASGRRVFMALDDAAIYTNLFTLLVGGAGNGKSWALQKYTRMLYELDLPVSGDVETPQGMWRFMTGDIKPINGGKPVPPYGGKNHKLMIPWANGVPRAVHPMNIVASEFIDFISMDDKAWINALNNIYDKDVYHYRTKGQGEDYIEGPYINLIGGLTTQIATGMQKENIINTGLARRTIFQYGERSWNDPHSRPVLTEVQKRAYLRCIEHLKKLKDVVGEFVWTDATGSWWDSWYAANLAAVPGRPPSVQSWYATKSTQLMKLAMLTSLSERFDRVLEVAHFELALAYLTELEKDLYKIFGGVGRNELADVASKILNHISLLPEPVSGRVILARFWRELPNRRGTKTELDDCINHLVSAGQLALYNVTHPGLPPDYIVATPSVMQDFITRQQGTEIIRETPAPSEPTFSAPSPQLDAIPTGSRSAGQSLTDPSTWPSIVPTEVKKDSAADQVEPQLASSAAIVPPPMVVK